MENCSEWESDIVSRGFLSFLSEFNTVFLLEVFSILFSYTDVLYNILQSESVDIMSVSYTHLNSLRTSVVLMKKLFVNVLECVLSKLIKQISFPPNHP